MRSTGKWRQPLVQLPDISAVSRDAGRPLDTLENGDDNFDSRIADWAFPLRQVSIDSVHEKNVRHGHISTLHIWPARRPLAASRAILLATLLKDVGTDSGRRKILDLMAGQVVDMEDDKGRKWEETRDGICRWGREDGPTLDRLRKAVRDGFGGRIPRVLDPFAGGGAIPLEGMRIGTEVVASDLSPTAWFVLRCTLHYPRLLAGERLSLPAWSLGNRDFVEAFLKARGLKGARLRDNVERTWRSGTGVSVGETSLPKTPSPALDAELAWHVRAWARRVMDRVASELADRYPTYAEFEPRAKKGGRGESPQEPTNYEFRSPQLLDSNDDARRAVDRLNEEFDSAYLTDPRNPRWVAKPIVAYLWARTATCTDCRAAVPLLKTRWLCKKDKKQAWLGEDMGPDGSYGVYGTGGAVSTTESGLRNGTRERDARGPNTGTGTMSSTGVTCPRCKSVLSMADLRREGRAGRLSTTMTAVVVDGQRGKEYRSPTTEELEAARVTEDDLRNVWTDIPFGFPNEPTPKAGPGAARAFSVGGYGFTTWRSLFTNRQLLTLGLLVREIRNCRGDLAEYSDPWHEALVTYLACGLSKLTGYSSAFCQWINTLEAVGQTFSRFALSMIWDFCEVNPMSARTGGFAAMTEWVARYLDLAEDAVANAPIPTVLRRSAIDLQGSEEEFDVICTDPPYYDAIPYSDLMDFFHVWLRRTLHELSPEIDHVFSETLGPKWDNEANDGELIDDASRFDGDRETSKHVYEDGMFRALKRFYDALREDGRLVLVFANKSPDAWETLVSALIRAGFVVTASWPIQTERQSRLRSVASAALSSSIWIVCRKRPARTKPGWDHRVLAEMEEKITQRLRDFWDAGIRGPDFVWAATGPALEAFSKHPVVKLADAPGERLTVAEFLRRVRRMVVGFVVNRLLRREGGATDDLDDPTTYYLLHRNDFGMEKAPAGACILYALSCNVSDTELVGRMDLLAKGGSGADLGLQPWHRRKGRKLGEPDAGGRAPPLIDCVHKVMQLWKTGERSRVDAYLGRRGLWRHDLFARIVQAVIELAPEGSDERSLLESIQNHLRSARPGSGARGPRQGSLF